MIQVLNHSQGTMAQQIHTVFQRSYKIEGELLSIENFPPLMRSANDIQNTSTQFIGYFDNNCLAAVIEITDHKSNLDIDSLVVDPSFFRRGLAGKLIHYILQQTTSTTATVETAAANTPAVTLYEKHGFIETRQWTPDHGIKKIELVRRNSCY